MEAGIFSLEEYPYRCAERKTGRYANRGYRELIVDSYIIIYKIHASGYCYGAAWEKKFLE